MAARLSPLILIPAYNEAEHVADVVRRVLPGAGAVLVVDDGSRDETAERARQAGAEVYRFVRLAVRSIVRPVRRARIA